MSDFNSKRLLGYYAPTSYTQKTKLVGKSGQNSLILQPPPPPPSCAALLGCKRGIGNSCNLFPRFKLKTACSDIMLSYYASSGCTQKTKLMGKGRQFTYTLTKTNQMYKDKAENELLQSE
jgi:hypothetical protein